MPHRAERAAPRALTICGRMTAFSHNVDALKGSSKAARFQRWSGQGRKVFTTL
jgi:hypothetical protein